MLKIRIHHTATTQGSVADPHHFDADPDPDPAFHFDADPDPGSGSFCQLGMVNNKTQMG